MKPLVQITLAFAAGMLLAACATREGAWVPHDFTPQEAFQLAVTYRLMYLGGCGWCDPPIARADYWEVPVHIGIVGAPEGAVHVDRHTGTLSYRWRDKVRPTVTPRELWHAVHDRKV